MGWNDHFDDSELANLPPEAYEDFLDNNGPFEPANLWLKTAEEDHALIAMREWFLARFCDPANETPYAGREGGYLFIHGGPYDPEHELFKRLGGVVDDKLIAQVVDEMHQIHGDQWAPTFFSRQPEEYDEYFELTLDARSQPLEKLQERLRQSQLVLALEGESAAKALALQMVFSGLIGVLESFLWETAHYWVDNDEQALHDFVTKLPHFYEKTFKLGDIFKRQKGLKEEVKGYLQGFVWHKWEKAEEIYHCGLNCTLPAMSSFNAALKKRHDIVHRSGHDKNGTPVTVTLDEIRQLCSQVAAFAIEVDSQLAARGRQNHAEEMQAGS